MDVGSLPFGRLPDIETSDGMADFMEVVNLRDEARNLKGLSDCDKLFQYAQELWEESKSDGERYAAITGLEAAMFHGDAPQSEAASIIEEAYREGKGLMDPLLKQSHGMP